MGYRGYKLEHKLEYINLFHYFDDRNTYSLGAFQGVVCHAHIWRPPLLWVAGWLHPSQIWLFGGDTVEIRHVFIVLSDLYLFHDINLQILIPITNSSYNKTECKDLQCFSAARQCALNSLCQLIRFTTRSVRLGLNSVQDSLFYFI